MSRGTAAYYTESVTETLLHMGITLTEAQSAELEESLSISCSNESLAFGRDCIPNPLDSEVRRIERQRTDEAEDADKRLTAAEKKASDTIRSLNSYINRLETQLEAARRAA